MQFYIAFGVRHESIIDSPFIQVNVLIIFSSKQRFPGSYILLTQPSKSDESYGPLLQNIHINTTLQEMCINELYLLKFDSIMYMWNAQESKKALLFMQEITLIFIWTSVNPS